MHFEVYAWRFVFTAVERVVFPAGKAVNTIRGAFGLVASPEIFSPEAESGPSGFRARPRPFVFRAVHLDGQRIDANSKFYFDVHSFETRTELLPEITGALERVAAAGLGAARARVRMDEVIALHDPPLVIPLDTPAAAVAEVRLTFVTPTELKTGSLIAEQPGFPVLFARIRDRVAALSAFYGAGPLEAEALRSISARAGSIRLSQADLRDIAVERRSSRSGQQHAIGGFTGAVTYEGELAEFVPWLRCAEWTGVGRHTGFGNGVIRIDKIT